MSRPISERPLAGRLGSDLWYWLSVDERLALGAAIEVRENWPEASGHLPEETRVAAALGAAGSLGRSLSHWAVKRRHEQFAAGPTGERKLIIDLLRRGAPLPKDLAQRLQEALELLDYGRVDPLLRPKTERRRTREKTILQLRALRHVAYREARLGLAWEQACREVSGAYGVKVDAISKWRDRLRAFRSDKVEHVEALGRNQGNQAREGRDLNHAALDLSDTALEEDGRLYQNLNGKADT